MNTKQDYDGNKIVSWQECDWKPREVVTSIPKIKPSAAIRIGHPLSDENTNSFRYCAIGAMWRGYGLTEKDLMSTLLLGECGLSHVDMCRNIGIAMGLPDGLAEKVSSKHCAGMPRMEIADWLEAQGL